MRIKVTMPSEDGKRIRERILEGAEKVEADEMGEQQWEAVSSNTLNNPRYLDIHDAVPPLEGDAY